MIYFFVNHESIIQLCGLRSTCAKPRENVTLNYMLCSLQTTFSNYFFFFVKPRWFDKTAVKPRLKGEETLHVDIGALFVIQSTVHVIVINYRFSGISMICCIRDKFSVPYFSSNGRSWRYLNRTCTFICIIYRKLFPARKSRYTPRDNKST